MKIGVKRSEKSEKYFEYDSFEYDILNANPHKRSNRAPSGRFAEIRRLN